MKKILKIGFFQLIFAWYDLWIGFYYDVGHKTLYFIPIPCLVFRFELKGKKMSQNIAKIDLLFEK